MANKRTRQKKANEVSEEDVRADMETGGREPEDVDELLEDLAVELGVSSPDDIQYGEGRTPYGKKYMAGAANTGVVTHFWDDDDGWQKMPEPFELASSYMSERMTPLRGIVVQEIRRLLEAGRGPGGGGSSSPWSKLATAVRRCQAQAERMGSLEGRQVAAQLGNVAGSCDRFASMGLR